MSKNFPELRILAILGIIALSWHLLTIFGAFLTIFADVFLISILSLLLAFILDPLVAKISNRGLPRIWAAALTYLVLAIAGIALVWVILPTTVTQISQLSYQVPAYLPENSILANRLEAFLSSTAANSVYLASSLASVATGIFLVFIISFYILISKKEISKFFLDVIPNDYKEDYLFLEKTLNQTFASFIQVQVVMGLCIGLISFLTLLILGFHFALSTSILAAILAMIPVVGPILFLIPVILAGLTVTVEKMVIAIAIILISAQLLYNVVGPKLLGSALKIHPIIVLFAFLVGYKVAGAWGAVFAVPVTSAIAIISRDLLKYWKEEADK